jgi:hypothetical protein
MSKYVDRKPSLALALDNRGLLSDLQQLETRNFYRFYVP